MIVLIISIILTILVTLFTFLLFGVSNLLLINGTIVILFVVIVNIRYRGHVFRVKKIEFLFSFIELFILNYDVQKSVEGALEVVMPLLDIKAQKLFISLKKEQDATYLLQQLRTYFAHHYYESFMDIINVITSRGGEIMKVSEVLLYSISQSEARMLKLRRIDTSYLVKFTFSWFFVMLVAIVFRFALTSLLSFNNLPLVYVGGNEAFIGLLLISFFLVIENTIRSGKRGY